MYERSLAVSHQSHLPIILKVTQEIIKSATYSGLHQRIVDLVYEEMRYIGAMISRVDIEKQTTKMIAISNTPIVKAATAFLGKDPHLISVPLLDNVCKRKVIKEKKMVIMDDLKERLCPSLPAHVVDSMQKQANIGSVVAVPVLVDNRDVYGILTFFLQETKDEVQEIDTTVMTAVADLVGMVMRNRKVYQESQRTNQELIAANLKNKEQMIQLEEMNEHLQELDSVKSEFLSIASHQLRTPLTTIRGYLSLLDEGCYGVLSKEQHEVLFKMQDNLKRLLSLVNDLLSLARIESGIDTKGTYVERDMHGIIENVIDEVILKSKKKGISLHWKKPVKQLLIEVDEQRIRQVVMNLIDKCGGIYDFWLDRDFNSRRRGKYHSGN